MSPIIGSVTWCNNISFSRAFVKVGLPQILQVTSSWRGSAIGQS